MAVAVFGPYVDAAEFHSDDWAIGGTVMELGYTSTVSHLFDVLGSKPMLAVLLPIPHALFGYSPELHFALAIVLSVATAGLFYALLRMLRLGRVPALTIAVLALLFPWSDSARFWATGGINNIAVCLYLLGAIVALKGLCTSGRRSVALHAGAVALYMASVLTYEVTGVVALITGAVYLTKAPARRVIPRWGADVAGVGVALIYSALTTVKTTAPLGDQLSHLREIGRDAGSLLGEALVPVAISREAVIAFALVAIATAAVVALRAPASPKIAELRRWLAIAAGAALAWVASYVLFVPSAYWTPRSPGLENRVNVLATLPLTVLVYAVIMLAAVLVALAVRRWDARIVLASTTLACAAIAVGYLVQLRQDGDRYQHAWAAERRVLTATEASVGRPPPSTTIFTFGHPAQVAPRLPVFYDRGDLFEATSLRWRDPTLAAYPVFSGSRLRCGRDALRVRALSTPSSSPLRLQTDPFHPDRNRVPYRAAVFVDVPLVTAKRIDGAAECRTALRRFTPGPFQ